MAHLTPGLVWAVNVFPRRHRLASTGCSLSGSGNTVFAQASSKSGDCGGRLNCTVPGTPPDGRLWSRAIRAMA
uniref:Uncharacterized protein n=2 Tax=Oryza TaxID=4527 RepID=A0A0D3F8N9_9ORYZ